jgi:broad specificity phosphatase PhoE
MQLVLQVQTVLTSPLKRAQATAKVISRVQSLAGFTEPKVQTLDELTNRGMGEWEGRHALEVWVTNKPLSIWQFCV